MKKTLIILTAALMLASCGSKHQGQTYGVQPIYPDYMGVTVPTTIAPLNFEYTIDNAEKAVTTFSAGSEKATFKGREIRWNARKWHKMLEAAAGGEITVTSSVLDTAWTIKVSTDPIDYAIDYRLIAPGYEVFSKMGIYERELSSYKQRTLFENTQFDGCVNCHSYNQCSPEDFSLHIRGAHGATVIRKNDSCAAYNTATDSTLGFCVYPYWHPSGNYIAYSTNTTRQSFHVKSEKLIEVFDLASDLQVYDIRTNEIVTAHSVKQDDVWETFPVFSPDGETLYFCAAAAKAIPSELEQVRYNLYKVSFNPETGAIGSDIQLLLDAEADNKSISFPKPSFDGKYIMYTLSDYGQFSIWHHEADLWLYEVETGKTYPLDGVNSGDTESYHNWSSNSRWFVFSSRRDDGLYTRLYICHIDENGVCGKPFMLPQENPATYYEQQMRSYNVPEFVTGPVDMNRLRVQKMVNSPERVDMGFRWAE